MHCSSPLLNRNSKDLMVGTVLTAAAGARSPRTILEDDVDRVSAADHQKSPASCGSNGRIPMTPAATPVRGSNIGPDDQCASASANPSSLMERLVDAASKKKLGLGSNSTSRSTTPRCGSGSEELDESCGSEYFDRLFDANARALQEQRRRRSRRSSACIPNSNRSCSRRRRWNSVCNPSNRTSSSLLPLEGGGDDLDDEDFGRDCDDDFAAAPSTGAKKKLLLGGISPPPLVAAKTWSGAGTPTGEFNALGVLS